MADFLTMDELDLPAAQVRITSRLIDSLYTEAMILADEARSYFDDAGREDRATLQPFARVGFACELLKVTTRVMHIVAWLLTQRAIESGEIPDRDGRRPERRLGHAQESDQAVVTQLPESAQRLINASADLYARVKRLDEGGIRDGSAAEPGAGAHGSAGTRPERRRFALARTEPRFGRGILISKQVHEFGGRTNSVDHAYPLA